MSTITFDTLRFAERLRTAGVPEAQAKAEAEALRDVLSEALDMTLATRADILATKTELKTDIVHLDANRETGVSPRFSAHPPKARTGKQGSAHGFLPTHPKQELKSVATGAAPAAPVLFLLHSLAQKTGEFHEHHYI